MSSLAFARPMAAPPGIDPSFWGQELSTDDPHGRSLRVTGAAAPSGPVKADAGLSLEWRDRRSLQSWASDDLGAPVTKTRAVEQAGRGRQALLFRSRNSSDVGAGPPSEPVAARWRCLASRNPEPPDGDPRRDERLLTDYLAGDFGAFDLIVGRYRQDLYFFLLRFMGERASAEDAVQETFLRLHQYAGQFDARREFRPWLYSIAANWARDVLRTRVRRTTVSLQSPVRGGEGDACELLTLLPADASPPERRMETAEVCGRVQSVLAAMPRHLRQILHLAYFEQYGYQQIAEVVGIPLGTVKSRLHAAVAHFANRWQDKHGSTAGPRRQARSRRRLPRRRQPATAGAAVPPPLVQLLARAG
jgi:RNA polymerase sigma-70 factor (ECF subfamily)